GRGGDADGDLASIGDQDSVQAHPASIDRRLRTDPERRRRTRRPSSRHIRIAPSGRIGDPSGMINPASAFLDGRSMAG
ncbi:MAG: hypothetical protein AAGA65_29240, partial [Actinomycetota bacterium]